MANVNRSKRHHWWPVGLQSYWADRVGDVSWIEPDGSIKKKRFTNRKIGFKRYGHTIFRGTGWESNFEGAFNIDNEVPRIISALRDLKPLDHRPKDLFLLFKLLTKKERSLSDVCNFYHLDASLQRNLLLLILSLLIRSPGNRFRYEGYSIFTGRPRDENVGKANIAQNYQIATRVRTRSHLKPEDDDCGECDR